jgi:hypothetical protein
MKTDIAFFKNIFEKSDEIRSHHVETPPLVKIHM